MKSFLVFRHFVFATIIYVDVHGHYRTTTSTKVKCFIDLPETVKVVNIDPTTLIKFDNKGERIMGAADDKCDNGRVNLATDFDPGNKTEVERYTTCFQNETWEAGNVFDHILTRMNVPRRYIPIHKCMHITIRYLEQIPSIGPHRPLWARYGEYKYLPPQRWLHNVEHGAIVALYHPCADPDQVQLLKQTIKKCLFRYVITPYLNLTKERPIAIVGWSASLEMSIFDYDLVLSFIKCFAKVGPEHVFRDGQYHQLLVSNARYVTSVIDDELCPRM